LNALADTPGLELCPLCAPLTFARAFRAPEYPVGGRRPSEREISSRLAVGSSKSTLHVTQAILGQFPPLHLQGFYATDLRFMLAIGSHGESSRMIAGISPGISRASSPNGPCLAVRFRPA
jgi:hypothetical protein